jgi:hypothetical protein
MYEFLQAMASLPHLGMIARQKVISPDQGMGCAAGMRSLKKGGGI